MPVAGVQSGITAPPSGWISQSAAFVVYAPFHVTVQLLAALVPTVSRKIASPPAMLAPVPHELADGAEPVEWM